MNFAASATYSVGIRDAASSAVAEPALGLGGVGPYDSAFHDYLNITASSGVTDLNGSLLNLAFSGTGYAAKNTIITLISMDGSDSGRLSGEFANATGSTIGATPISIGNYAGSDWYIYYRVENNGLNAMTSGNDVIITNIPEPSTIAMMIGAAVMGLGGLAWRRKQRAASKKVGKRTVAGH